MAEPATLTGRAAGKLQAALYYARKQRRARQAASPTNTVAPEISGTTTVGQELTVDEGTWTGSPVFRYEWRRDAEIIAGATEASYTLVEDDVDAEITATVRASNGSGVAGATSEAVGPVAAA